MDDDLHGPAVCQLAKVRRARVSSQLLTYISNLLCVRRNTTDRLRFLAILAVYTYCSDNTARHRTHETRT